MQSEITSSVQNVEFSGKCNFFLITKMSTLKFPFLWYIELEAKFVFSLLLAQLKIIDFKNLYEINH